MVRDAIMENNAESDAKTKDQSDDNLPASVLAYFGDKNLDTISMKPLFDALGLIMCCRCRMTTQVSFESAVALAKARRHHV